MVCCQDGLLVVLDDDDRITDVAQMRQRTEQALVVTLMQTGKLESFPIVAMGVDFWTNLDAFVQDTMIAQGTISRKDLELLILIALSDGDLSRREMYLLQKYSQKINVSMQELTNIINDIESGKLAY